MQDYFASLIRTAVPVAVGALISWLAQRGLNLDGAEISGWLTPLSIAAYYAAIRAAEKKYPSVGWLLGLAKQPGYSNAPPPAPAPADNPAFPA